MNVSEMVKKMNILVGDLELEQLRREMGLDTGEFELWFSKASREEIQETINLMRKRRQGPSIEVRAYG